MLDDLNPTPAYVMGRRYDYLAWNAAADGLFSLSEASPPYGRNLVWRLFTSPTMRELPNWEQLARGTLGEFRAASARYPGDQQFEELIEHLERVSREFRRLWLHHDVRSSLDGHKVIEHPLLGCLEFEHVTLQVVNNPDLRVMIYTPTGVTRAKLQIFLETKERASS